MIDYKALAERIERLADDHDLYATQSGTDEAASNCHRIAADLRTVVSLLEGMAEEKPAGWLHRVYLVDDLVDKAMLDTADPAQVPLGPSEVVRTVVPLFLHPAPQPQSLAPTQPTHDPAMGVSLYQDDPQPQPAARESK